MFMWDNPNSLNRKLKETEISRRAIIFSVQSSGEQSITHLRMELGVEQEPQTVMAT